MVEDNKDSFAINKYEHLVIGETKFILYPIEHCADGSFNFEGLETLCNDADAVIFEYHPEELKNNQKMANLTILWKEQLPARVNTANQLVDKCKDSPQITLDPAYDWKFQGIITAICNLGYSLPTMTGINTIELGIRSHDLPTTLIGITSIIIGAGSFLRFAEKTLTRMPNENDFRWLIIAKGLERLAKENKFKEIVLMYPQKHLDGITNLLNHPKLLNIMWNAMFPLRHIKLFQDAFLQIRIRECGKFTNLEIN